MSLLPEFWSRDWVVEAPRHDYCYPNHIAPAPHGPSCWVVSQPTGHFGAEPGRVPATRRSPASPNPRPGSRVGPRVSHGKQVLGDGQTRLRAVHKPIMKRRISRTVTSPRIGVTAGPTLEPGLGLGAHAGERLVARSLPTGTRPGSARNGDVGPPSSRLTTRRKVHEGPVQCGLGSSRGRGPRRPNPWTKTLAIGTWNVTSRWGGRSLSSCGRLRGTGC
ncbi:hypothetical protein L3Q82_011528 [Scortum barcoo]|uniref:Uncharacterized protein n=1 Tax=Scortum barcoo TaxID=214431 RepID=A0ACB8W5K3_9TELE|nr:hypothetical protein L3Q82_011528 [Scortum barcoo]